MVLARMTVVPAAGELPDLLVGEVLDHLAGARVAAEEVLADERAVLGLVGLVVAVRRDVHQVDQGAVPVGGQQRIPLPAPDHLDHVPAGAPEERLQLLDDLAVATDRAVEALQVAVDDEGEVVQLLTGGEPDDPERLRLVHLAVAEEGPDVLVGGVLDAAVVQVAVEPRLVDRVHRAEAHRDGGELPEVRHEPRVRVGGQPATGVADLLAEAVELLLGQPALEEGTRVDAGGGVALEVDLVAAARVVLAAEEVVEAHLVQRGGGGVGGDVPADGDTGPLGAVHHDRGVPADVRPDPPLDVLVAGEPRLPLRRDGVDVVGAAQRRDADLLLTAALQHPQHQVAGPALAAVVDGAVQRLQPLPGLVGVGVDELAGESVGDDRSGGAALADSGTRLLRCAHAPIVLRRRARRHATSPTAAGPGASRSGLTGPTRTRGRLRNGGHALRFRPTTARTSGSRPQVRHEPAAGTDDRTRGWHGHGAGAGPAGRAIDRWLRGFVKRPGALAGHDLPDVRSAADPPMEEQQG
jgi:hypothetical protein